MAVGLGASVPLTGRFGRAFPSSVAAVLATGVVFVVIRLLAPTSVRSTPEPALGGLVAEAEDSLAYFALRDDRAVVRGGSALVSYRGVGTVALAGGDPLGPLEDWPQAGGRPRRLPVGPLPHQVLPDRLLTRFATYCLLAGSACIIRFI
jgi:lysylphosphatidylglycerol synthetase-like protein (DUF2156 family)